MTFAAVKVQFGRMVRIGCKQYEANALLPLCQKCVTRWMKLIAAIDDVKDEKESQ